MFELQIKMRQNARLFFLVFVLVSAMPAPLWAQANDASIFPRGSGTGAFSDDAMALEIGPVSEPDAPALDVEGLEPRKKHCFRVLYRGTPLPETPVAIATDDGWEKTEITDANGVFTIVPFETNEKNKTLLFVVSHRDDATQKRHVARLTMHVCTPTDSSWKRTVLVFGFFAAGAAALFVLFVYYRMHRKRKRGDEIMRAFENQKIREARP
jgi:hypothetical protein